MKIGIIGLGLIGGSIFKSLKKYENYDVIGISSSVKNEENVFSDYEKLKECHLIFVCTPMNVTISVLEKLESIVSNETIVTDVCSLKEFVSQKEYSFKFIPSHPMAGTENQGWKASFAELFIGANWVITPFKGEVLPEQEILENVIKDLGANIIITTPEEHDKAVSLISHMPLVIAQALCENIRDNKLAQVLAASGFKDTTRLALSNVEMANDMVTLNIDNINKSLNSLKLAVNRLLEDDYINKAQQIKEFRKNLY